MPPRARVRAALAAATTVAIATTLVACSSDDGPEPTLRAFLDGWPTGELDGVAFISPDGAPIASADVAEAIAQLSGQLRELVPALEIGEVDLGEGVARAEILVVWPLAASDDPPTWSYRSTVRLTEGDDGWQVIFEPKVVHPELAAGDELVVRRTSAARGDILDGSGQPLVTARDVVDVGIWVAQATDLDGDLAVLDDGLRSIGVQIDMSALRDRIEAADPDQFVPVVTLRWDDYEPIRGQIRDLGATTFRERQRHLAPSRTFARALLGIVDEVTAEIIENNPGVYAPGDQVGQGGLSERYDAHLRGMPGQTVLAARTAPDGTVNHTELFAIDPTPGADLPTTIDPAVQAAAEQALHGDDRRASLVAIRISDGAVLAVANTHGSDANPVNLGLTGAVPPGSTFKVVTAYALLAAGEVGLDTTVDCPGEFTVEGRSFRNADNFALGQVPFLESVARSCNTAFASLAPRLGDDGLAAAGAELGLGGDWDLGLTTFTGEVSTGGGQAERAAAAFGQGTTVVSPAAMAAATAAVGRGAWLAPILIIDPDEPPAEPAPLDSGAIADLHTALREVVTSGTGTALRDAPGGDVYGKTGSAEAGDLTHGWFVGWQGDLAFAIFVEDGRSGSGSAVPLAGQFLRTLS
jgi:cell division protein FtsI/penicillin-binding protein 2